MYGNKQVINIQVSTSNMWIEGGHQQEIRQNHFKNVEKIIPVGNHGVKEQRSEIHIASAHSRADMEKHQKTKIKENVWKCILHTYIYRHVKVNS
jgi:hypothetical protein